MLQKGLSAHGDDDATGCLITKVILQNCAYANCKLFFAYHGIFVAARAKKSMRFFHYSNVAVWHFIRANVSMTCKTYAKHVTDAQ